MIKPVVTVLPENTLSLAVKRMHRFEISSLVVIRKGRFVGILTKRDFLESISQMEKLIRKMDVHFSVKDIEIDEIQKA